MRGPCLTRPGVGIHKNQPVRKSTLSTSCTQFSMHAPDVPHDLKVSKWLDGTPEIRYPPDSIMLMVVNFSKEELTLPKETVLGLAQEISENLVVSVSNEENADKNVRKCTGRAYRSVCVSHLVDGDVVDSCFDVRQRTWRLWQTKPHER